jgi:pyruvate dehydrogenase E2 component (dihydrolipoamide acetyltransferase)
MDSRAVPVPNQSLKGETTIEEPGRAGGVVARRSAEIRATVPDLELSTEADADRLLDRATREEVTTTAILVSACAAALHEFPRVNGAYRDARYEMYARVNVGILIPFEDSQPTATILDAGARSLRELDDELTRLSARARSGELTPPEQAGATFTFSDLGQLGVHRAAGLVPPSQAAMLTAGAIRDVAVVRDGAVLPGHQLTLTLTSDHRIVYGAQAAAFLGRVVELVQT